MQILKQNIILFILSLVCCTSVLAETKAVTAAPDLYTPTGAATVDLNTTSAIQTKISQDPSLVDIHLKVSTENNIVTLEGEVDNQVQANSAVNIAKSISGVRSVINKITVKPTIGNTSTSPTPIH